MEKEKTHKKNSGKKWPNMETCMNLPRWNGELVVQKNV
jgi:hypothetical protein